MLRQCIRGLVLVLLAFGLSGAAPIPAPRPVLRLKKAHPPQQKLRLFAFEGSFTGRIHRPGPEHFKLVRLPGGKEVPLTCSYEKIPEPEGKGCPIQGKVQKPRLEADKYQYNQLFQGVRLFLDNGAYDAKEGPQRNGYLELYARAKLEPGVRYRLTWACWPVGAAREMEAICDFIMPN